jgi:hypothetical protein
LVAPLRTNEGHERIHGVLGIGFGACAMKLDLRRRTSEPG